MSKVLFILKRGNGYGYHGYCHHHHSSGLKNSAQMCVDMLNAAGVWAKLVEVTDNNDIDREVTLYQPTAVIIEALWVVPEKFDVLKRLHPTVEWIVRLHSNIPFLAMEGIAISWIRGYLERDVAVGVNSRELDETLRRLFFGKRVLLLPNYYPLGPLVINHPPTAMLNIGCFGAVRPLKNQLTQAIAAIQYANTRFLRFHINASRVEQRADGVLENLESLFAFGNRELVKHPWMDHNDFLELIKKMDASMCVSFSETFCIVAADTVACGVPLVCSNQIPWASRISIAEPTSVNYIQRVMADVTEPAYRREAAEQNWAGLRRFVEFSRDLWLQLFL